MGTEIVDNIRNTNIEPMLASPQVKITEDHSRENEGERYKCLILQQEVVFFEIKRIYESTP